MSEITLRPKLGWRCTYIVTGGTVDAPVRLGFVRWDPEDVWVARTTGNATSAASIRRFATQKQALTWLQGAIDGVHLRRKGVPHLGRSRGCRGSP